MWGEGEGGSVPNTRYLPLLSRVCELRGCVGWIGGGDKRSLSTLIHVWSSVMIIGGLRKALIILSANWRSAGPLPEGCGLVDCLLFSPERGVSALILTDEAEDRGRACRTGEGLLVLFRAEREQNSD